MASFQDRPWLRRFVGLAVGLLILLFIEGFCRLAGLGKPDPASDPFVSFEGTSPLFTTDPRTNSYVTASERLKYFVEDRFPRKKAENTYRIFCLGGSTVQGRPYSIQTSFTTWLRLGLEAAYPDKNFNVVNCGGVSYASYRLIPILKECLNYEPDLFIVCTGQNEFLEERTYAQTKRWRTAHAAASKLRLYHLLQSKLRPDSTHTDISRPILKQEVDALLDYRGGLEGYQRDDTWKRRVQEHYQTNIKRIISIAKNAGAPIMFLKPPVNLKDCPPFKSDGPANESYERGQQCLARADYRNAETYLWRALQEDLCPLRLLPAMAEDLRNICANYRVPHLDLHTLLGRECPQGLLGNEILVDHVHPSIRGHQIIGNALLEHLQPTLGPPNPGWEHRRDRTFQVHLDSLDALYYAHGQQRLRNLRLWTKGRTDGPRFRNQSSLTRE